MGGRPSGFDHLRVGLAVAVLLWHSVQISYGTPAALALWRSPAGLLIETILPLFFALSGFLVSGSLERSPTLLGFLLQRAIRIYPALCVEVVLAAVVLGPLVTRLPLSDYVAAPEFRHYFQNALGLIHFELPGVFEQNPFPAVVNTSLWTVPYELECYGLIAGLALVGYRRSEVLAAILFGLATIAVWADLASRGLSGTPPGGVHGRILLLCFLAGSLVFRLRHRLPWHGPAALVAGLAAVVLLRFDGTVIFAPLPAAYATSCLGLLDPKRGRLLESGDYSYGIYLYAAPIQQTAALILGAAGSWAMNVALALPATVIMALLSWHLVERPCLTLKRALARPQSATSPKPPVVAPASRAARTTSGSRSPASSSA